MKKHAFTKLISSKGSTIANNSRSKNFIIKHFQFFDSPHKGKEKDVPQNKNKK